MHERGNGGRAAAVDAPPPRPAEQVERLSRDLCAALARERQTRGRLERLDGILQAVRALGHKINNPLTAVIGRAQILQMNKDRDPQVLKAAQVIEESSRRIADHVRELSLLAREARSDDAEPAPHTPAEG